MLMNFVFIRVEIASIKEIYIKGKVERHEKKGQVEIVVNFKSHNILR
jgi:hypothetical protein